MPKITKLLKQDAREGEKPRKEFEEQQKRWRREEEERRLREEEAARLKHFQAIVASWRLPRDVRACVAEIQALVTDADLQIAEGRGADQELLKLAACGSRARAREDRVIAHARGSVP